MPHNHHYNKGFTLIEVAVVVMAVGIFMIPLAQIYNVYESGRRLSTTKANIIDANASISSYKQSFLTPHYPCPSDRGLPPGDPNYGREFNGGVCTLAALQAILGTLGAAPRCTATGGFCMVRGVRDTAADADTNFDPVLIGGIPIISIKEQISTDPDVKIPPNDVMFDGYYNQLTYAVTQSQVDSALYNAQYGAIAVVDENNIPTAGINNDGSYILISHGEDGKGAYSREGFLHAACSGILTRDGENCNNDGTFRQAMGIFKANTVSFYDDVTYIGKSGSSELWSYIYDASGNNTHKIYNLNVGNIGIKTSTPETKIDVNGTVRVDNTARTTQICKKDGTMCFDVDAITGAGKIKCASSSQVMRGINAATADCITPTFSTVKDIDCGAGWVSGIKANGDPQCTN